MLARTSMVWKMITRMIRVSVTDAMDIVATYFVVTNILNAMW